MPDIKILGIDPSLNQTGLCLPDCTTAVLSPPHKCCGPKRLMWLRDAIQAILDTFNPDLVALEDYSFDSTGRVIDLAEWGGILRLMLYEQEMPVAKIAPSALKKYATGKGMGKKEVVTSAISARTGIVFANSDECDAWVLAAMASDHYGWPRVAMPQAHRAALIKVPWPTLERWPIIGVQAD